MISSCPPPATIFRFPIPLWLGARNCSTNGDIAQETPLDYRVVNTEWGIELLRNRDRLAERCKRFRLNGRHYKAIQDETWLTGL